MESLLIIKIGGNVIDDEKKLNAFLRDLSALPGKKILVHGGGKAATQVAQQLNIPQQMIEGRRITDAATLKVVTMVYAGLINKSIVAQLQQWNCNAMGLCGADGNSILAHKREHTEIDYGYAGDIDKINTAFLVSLLQKEFTLVFSPITHDKSGQLLNTNADTIAQELARALSSQFDLTLVYAFEKAGVLKDTADEESVIHQLNSSAYQQLKTGGFIFAGMIPKLDNAFAALQFGVKKVIIGKAEALSSLVSGQAGTTITHD